MAEVKCVYCQTRVCTDDIAKTPHFCPRRITAKALEKAEAIRQTDSEVMQIAEIAKSVETEGYRKWPRVRELIEFSTRLGIEKIGVAFCVGLKEETAQLAKILDSHGFVLSTVACSVNGGCNPVGQALTLNQQSTELNVIMGLCMGHDILFTKFSEAPVTTLVVKDRAMCHNPAAPLVNRYWRDTFLQSK
jgi:uncharacterized metal-binding protein